MKLKHEFIQLPIRFDVEALQQALAGIDEQHWKPHHEGFAGNFSVPLVSVGGEHNNAFKGPMGTTDVLEQSAYLKQVIGSFSEVIGRSRLMGLAPGTEVPHHSDINYHWYKRVRIHVPIVTDPRVTFYCGERSVHMQAGEAWIFDSWKYHRVVNESDVFRVHLVIDIAGSSRFWSLAEQGNVPWLPAVTDPGDFKMIAPGQVSEPIRTEQFNTPLVMTPGEMEGLAQELFDELDGVSDNPAEDAGEFRQRVKNFCHDWRVLWGQYGWSEAGWPHYHALRQRAFEGVNKFDSTLRLANGTQAPRMFLHCMIDPALNIEVKDSFLPATPGAAPSAPQSQPVARQAEQTIAAPASRNALCPCGSGERYKNCHGRLG